jgi:hypothetical protein
MKHREVWKVIIFGLITLGIYDIYWLYATRKEMIALGAKVPRVIIMFIPLFVLLGAMVLTIIGEAILAHATAENSAGPVTVGFNIFVASIILLSVVALIVIPFIWLYKYCQAVGTVTHGMTGVGLSYFLGLIFGLANVSFIWFGIIQDSFNKIGTLQAAQASVPATHSTGQSRRFKQTPEK